MKQGEAEYVTRFLDRWTRKTGSDWLAHPALARQLIIALRRRGWTPPKPKKGRTPMIDPQTAYVGMPVIRKSDGSRQTIHVIKGGDYPFSIGSMTCWYSADELDPVPDEPLKVGDSVEVTDSEHPAYGHTGVYWATAGVATDKPIGVMIYALVHWFTESQLRRIPPQEPAVGTPKRVEVVKETKTVQVTEIKSVTLNLPAERWRDLMLHDESDVQWKQLSQEIKSAIEQEARCD